MAVRALNLDREPVKWFADADWRVTRNRGKE